MSRFLLMAKTAPAASSFSPGPISGHRFAALARPIIAAPVSRGHGDVIARAERSRRRLSAGFPADAQMPTAWALREPGAALCEMANLGSKERLMFY